MKRLWWLLLLLPILYMSGPKPGKPDFNKEIAEFKEDTSSGIKPGNHSLLIINTDQKRLKTPYCLLYLHGFSASPMEGDPVMQTISKEFGMNLYAPRLFAHGLQNTEPMLEFESGPYWQSAVQSLMKAREFGDSVIIMGTSTGATLALMLAAAFPDQVQGLILYSPNIDLHDPRSFLLTAPWGLQIARAVKGSRYHTFDGPKGTKQYWDTRYRLEALVELKNLLNHSMKAETFTKISQPCLTLYYFKDEQHQDDVVSVEAIQKMFASLSTPAASKRLMAMPDATSHALVSGIWNPHTDQVIIETEKFMKEILRMDLR